MVETSLHELLKRHAPFSAIDKGYSLSQDGSVIECSRSGINIHASVKDDAGLHSVKLRLLPTGRIEAQCSCSSQEEMSEQWCIHALAATCKSSDLGFLEPSAGFETRLKVNAATPEEIAQSLEDAASFLSTLSAPISPNEIEIGVICDEEVFLLQLKVRGEIVVPSPLRPSFQRGLDAVLLEILIREGSWDEDRLAWYIPTSGTLEPVCALLREYKSIHHLKDKKTVTLEPTPIDAVIDVTWSKSAAKLTCSWVLPDGSETHKSVEVFGEGPCWVPVFADKSISLHPLSQRAIKLISIFPHNHTITIPRSQVGPILAALQEIPSISQFVRIKNKDAQPKAVVMEPLPVLEVSLRNTTSEHFTSHEKIELLGNLVFEYPEPPHNENIVYLPDREAEAGAKAFIAELGFYYDEVRKIWTLDGDSSLDFLTQTHSSLPSSWRVKGISEAKQKIKLAEINLHVSITSPEAQKNEKIDWFDCHIALTQGGAPLAISSLLRLQRNDELRWIKLENGAFAEVPGGSLKNLRTILGFLDAHGKHSPNIKTKISRAQAIAFTTYEDDHCAFTVDKSLKTLSQKLRSFDGIAPLKLKKGFQGTLRPYQKEGVQWLQFLDEYELSGILADEMGLGKTVQTLAFLNQKYASSKGKLPTLVITPTSVMTNWAIEAHKFTPNLSVLLLHGPKRKSLFSKIPESDIVITSFALLRTDKLDLEQYRYGYIVLDEAQNIKNPQAATTKAAKALRADKRLALTGTPTENRPLELWSIMDFLMPGYLGTSEFFKNHIERAILNNVADTSITKFLTAKTKPFILRRRKDQVEKQLPPKVETTVYVDMASSQRELYAQVLADIRPKIFDTVKKKGLGASTVSILAALLRLRQICNHPNSIGGLQESSGYESGKFSRLQDIIEESLENNRKVIVYSQFLEMLRLMREWADDKRISHLYLDGSTQNRQELINQFNQDDSLRLFFVSLKAGGTGINLTAADTVIIYDPWWNPAVEDQAVDRAHRIGQTKTVNVYRLVTIDSVEEKMLALKARKSQVVDALINQESLQSLKLSVDDLEQLFSPMSSAT